MPVMVCSRFVAILVVAMFFFFLAFGIICIYTVDVGASPHHSTGTLLPTVQ